jgi:glycosyltransferase involved in cell wall biosynthesis
LKTKKALFLTPYPFDKAPSQRLKFEQYYPYFEANGFSITKSAFIDDAFWEVIYKKGGGLKKILYTIKGYLRRISDLSRIRKYDIVFVHLWVTPLGPPFFEWLVCKLARSVIYDIDDLVYMSIEKGLIRLLKGKTKPIFLMKKADHIITCTPYLDKFVRKYNSNTSDLGVTVNTETYIPVNPYSNDHQIIVGWSGSHSTSRYLALLKIALQKAYKLQPFKLLVMGDSSFNIEGVDVEAINWSLEKEIPTLQRMDIGIYPLPFDEEWVWGKGGGKALQYMALGIPTIATNHGLNPRIIEDGVSGFLVSSDDEWIEKIVTLIKDAQLRKVLGMQGLKRVQELFSVKANYSKYLYIFNNVIREEQAQSKPLQA